MKDDDGIALTKAILERFESLGVQVEKVTRVARPWSCIAFAGTRHRFGLHISGDGASQAADRFRVGLDAEAFRLAGHILADIAVSEQRTGQGDSASLTIEALTVESR